LSTATRPAGAFALATLILAAVVANLNLTVANVALPDIGQALGASQVGLNFVAVGFTLGLAASVLYLGAVGDRYGRKMLLLIGLTASIPLAAMAAWAPSIEVLIAARVLGGIAAGMVYPTTLSIIVALYSGTKRTQAIALWSGIGAGASALGPPVVGWLLTFSWWGAGFVISIPLAAAALLMSLRLPTTPRGTDSVDNISGVLSVVMVGTLIVAITFAPMPGLGVTAIALGAVAIVAIVLFLRRQQQLNGENRRPLFNLDTARRPTFWVAALAGIIVFGSLMGSFFIGQQFLQDVMGYSTFAAGMAVVPTAIMMMVFSPIAGLLIPRIGSRTTMAIGFVFVGVGFLLMFLWRSESPILLVAVTYAILGAGVGTAAAPASRSIMASVPASDLGMGSATNDLQRDLGGAIMQAIMGTLLVARYSSEFGKAFASAPSSEQSQLTSDAVSQMLSSFAGAETVAKSLPSADQQTLISAAQEAFTAGSNLAFAFAWAATVAGLIVVLRYFPKKDEEVRLETQYATPEPSAPH
jgi:DHA2 family multidrug resistance protein-like MFS transporter